MHKNRLEAFSDGVIAIIITIMVLELKVPHGAEWADLLQLWPVLLSYVISFVFIGIYWNNHHHLLLVAEKIHGGVLWPNLHLLFWLSLVPFTTAWMGENHFATIPVGIYGLNLLMCGVAYYFLSLRLIQGHTKQSALVRAIGNDFKGKISLILYITAIPLAFYMSWIAIGIYVAVAIMWLCPDERIERVLRSEK